jgi:hypothetical protein
LNKRNKRESVDRDTERFVDGAEESRSRDCSIASERPGTPGCSDGDGDTAEGGDSEDQESETESSARGAHDHVEDVGECLGGWR